MSRYEHGRIIAVNEVRFGSNLNGDHAAGVTSLTVEDAADFDETGGQLTINGQVIDYTTFDDDTGTITLAPGQSLASAAEDGDRVDAWDPLYGYASAEKVAQVQLDGEDDTNTDPLEATIALHLQDELGEGLRGTTGESVLLEQDGDEWRVSDVLARSQSAGVKFYDLDTYTAAANGAQAFTLTHAPISGSLHVGWGGLWQPHTEFTVAGRVVTVPDATGLILSGDVFDFRYAYRDGIVAPQATSPAPIPALWWKMDETSGTVAADATGNNRVGTIHDSVVLNAAPVFAGQGGSFNLAAGWVGASPYNPLFNQWTFTLDINLTSVSGFQPLAVFGTVSVYVSSGHLNIQRNIAGSITGATTLATGTSYRVAVVVSNDTGGQPANVTLYVNGTADGTGHTAGGAWTWAMDGPMTLGADGARLLQGRADNARIYGFALTAEEIATDWNGGAPL